MTESNELSTYRPPRGHVLILPGPSPDTFPDSVLVRPESYRPRNVFATVLAIGAPEPKQHFIQGQWHTHEESPDLKVGDIVMHPAQSKWDLGHEIQLGDQVARLLTFEQTADLLVCEP